MGNEGKNLCNLHRTTIRSTNTYAGTGKMVAPLNENGDKGESHKFGKVDMLQLT